jgi:biopolymer transport protein ExbB
MALLLAGVLVFAALVPAQDSLPLPTAAAAPTASPHPQTTGLGGGEGTTVSRLFDHFVVSGGAITWFILIPLSIAAIALAVEHALTIRRIAVVPPQTVERIRADLDARRYVDAVRYTAAHPSAIAEAVHQGLTQASKGYEAMQHAVADATEQYSARLFRKIEYLNVIGNIAPMVGLFGTVYGMILLFASIRSAGGIPEPAAIAGSISIALVTTFWGLLIAIPALSVHAVFRNRVEALAVECAATAERLLSGFQPGRAQESGAAVHAGAQLAT